MKVAKIIPCFPFFELRNGLKDRSTNGPTSFIDWESCFKELIAAEKTTDCGCDMDVFLFYRYLPNDKETGRNTIYKFNNNKTTNGKIFVYEMPNDETMGFSSIHYFLNLEISKEYDYIIYQEDDIIILPESDNYVKDSFDIINQGQYKIISYMMILDYGQIPTHIGGLFSLFPIDPLRKNIDTFPFQHQETELEINEWVLRSIINNDYSKIGYLTHKNNFPINYEFIELMYNHRHAPYWRNIGTCLFKIGL